MSPPLVNDRMGEYQNPKRRRQRLPQTAAPDTFEVTEEMFAEAEAIGVPADRVPWETEQFLDRHRAKGTKHSDWRAAWRSWMRKSVEFSKKAA